MLIYSTVSETAQKLSLSWWNEFQLWWFWRLTFQFWGFWWMCIDDASCASVPKATCVFLGHALMLCAYGICVWTDVSVTMHVFFFPFLFFCGVGMWMHLCLWPFMCIFSHFVLLWSGDVDAFVSVTMHVYFSPFFLFVEWGHAWTVCACACVCSKVFMHSLTYLGTRMSHNLHVMYYALLILYPTIPDLAWSLQSSSMNGYEDVQME